MYVKSHPLSNKDKDLNQGFMKKQTGPFTIESHLGGNVYWVNQNSTRNKIHGNQLVLGRKAENRLAPDKPQPATLGETAHGSSETKDKEDDGDQPLPEDDGPEQPPGQSVNGDGDEPHMDHVAHGSEKLHSTSNQEDEEHPSIASDRQNNLATSQHGSAAEESEEEDASSSGRYALRRQLTSCYREARLHTPRCRRA